VYRRGVPGLRHLLRAAPFLVGAVAATVWLRRRRQRRVLLEAAPTAPAIEAPAAEAQSAEPATVEAEAAPHDGAESEPRRPAGRFARGGERTGDRQPIDIVTVVDDLLQAGR